MGSDRESNVSKRTGFYNAKFCHTAPTRANAEQYCRLHLHHLVSASQALELRGEQALEGVR